MRWLCQQSLITESQADVKGCFAFFGVINNNSIQQALTSDQLYDPAACDVFI